MIFLHFSSAAMLFPLQHNMAAPHFSVKALCLPFCKIANGLCTCTFFCICFCGWGRFFLSPPGGPGCFIRRESGVGGWTVGELLFAWGASLLLPLNLVPLSVPALSENLSRGLRQLFPHPFPFCVSPPRKLKGPCLEVSDQKTRVSDM